MVRGKERAGKGFAARSPTLARGRLYLLVNAAVDRCRPHRSIQEMHKAIAYILLALGLALTPLAGEAQTPQSKPQQVPGQRQGPPQARRFDPRDTGPVAMLLRNRAELKLTAEQVTRLQEIDVQVELKNRPYVTQLVEMRRQLPRVPRGREPTPEQREAFAAQMRAAEPLMKSIDEHWKAAMRQVGQILTEEQKAKIHVLVANERRSGDGRRGDNDRD